jgi:hypothetical protein
VCSSDLGHRAFSRYQVIKLSGVDPTAFSERR